MKKSVMILCVVALSAQGSALAQGRQTDARRANVPPSDQEMTFPDQDVQGGVVTPVGATSRGNRRPTGISLLRTRQHFVQEMLKAVENL